MKIVQANGVRVRAYVEERDLGDVEVGAKVSVWLEGRPDAVIRGRVATVFRHQVRILDEPQLAATAGGPIVVRAGEAGTVVPEQSLYKVDVALDAGASPVTRSLKIRAYAVISTAPRHLAGRIWHRLVGLWRREIG